MGRLVLECRRAFSVLSEWPVPEQRNGRKKARRKVSRGKSAAMSLSAGAAEEGPSEEGTSEDLEGGRRVGAELTVRDIGAVPTMRQPFENVFQRIPEAKR